MEKYPDKLYSVPESIIGIMLSVMEQIPEQGIMFDDLKIKQPSLDVIDFVDALTCLFAIGAIKCNSCYFIEKSC